MPWCQCPSVCKYVSVSKRPCTIVPVGSLHTAYRWYTSTYVPLTATYLQYRVIGLTPMAVGLSQSLAQQSGTVSQIYQGPVNQYWLFQTFTEDVSVCAILVHAASVRLSVTEVDWRIIANLGFKFRSHFTAHCGRQHDRCVLDRRAASQKDFIYPYSQTARFFLIICEKSWKNQLSCKKNAQ